MDTAQKSPFKADHGRELLADEITAKAPADLVVALLSIAVFFGIDRTEAAVKNTYCKAETEKIFQGMNAVMKAM